MNAKIIDDLRQKVVATKIKIEEKELEIWSLNEEISSYEMEDAIEIEMSEEDDGETPCHDLDGSKNTEIRTNLMNEVNKLENEVLELHKELENAENDLMDVEEEF